MKKGKLLILLLAVLSLTVLFAACDSAESETSSETEAVTDVNAGNEEDTIGAVLEEQETSENEIYEFFDIYKEDESVVFDEISRLEGEVIDYDVARNIVALKTTEIDNFNMFIETVKVYDILTGEVMHEFSVSNSFRESDYDDTTDMTVSIDYPIIRVCYTSYVEDGDDVDAEYEVSYYSARVGGECIHTTDDENFEIYGMDNGLYCIKMGDKLVWIDRDLDIVRTVDTIFANGYDVEGFNAEYKGYLYSWSETELLIFNRSGMVSGKYVAGVDSDSINVKVLNNGNVLIQEFTPVTPFDSYDFIINGIRYVLKSSVMNFITGELTEIELDYVLGDLVNRYEQECNDAKEFVLIGEAENYGVVYKVASGEISYYADICVIDNDLNVLYTLKNDTVGLVVQERFGALNDSLYIAEVIRNGNTYQVIFDVDGNEISHYNAFGTFTDKYIVTNDMLYDYRLNPLYNIKENGYAVLGCVDNKIFLSKNNFESGAVEIYVINPDSVAPELFADGVKMEFVDVCDGAYVLYDTEREVYILYNGEGTELVVSFEELTIAQQLDGAIVVSTEFEGEKVIYALRKSIAE